MELRAYRDGTKIKRLAGAIAELAGPLATALGRPVQVMEVCGGHTHALFRFGLNQLLPPSVEFVHGPGCPVCVLPTRVIDEAVAIAELPGVIFASFGDPLRVPGSQKSLLEAKAEGADVRVLYSPFDAIALARENPDKEVVFFAIGFDTTMPGIAHSILTAAQQRISNLSFLCHPIRLMPTLCALLESGEVAIDGFIGPGHVSMVIGEKEYGPIAARFHKPLVIAGFEPLDFMQALYRLLRQMAEGRCEIENAYGRVVAKNGNKAAICAIDSVFTSDCDASWRGLGQVPGSGARIREDFARFDASRRFSYRLPGHTAPEPAYCNAVLTGRIKPHQCPHFQKSCTPATPLGALMVSSEGACSAYNHYGRFAVEEVR